MFFDTTNNIYIFLMIDTKNLNTQDDRSASHALEQCATFSPFKLTRMQSLSGYDILIWCFRTPCKYYSSKKDPYILIVISRSSLVEEWKR